MNRTRWPASPIPNVDDAARVAAAILAEALAWAGARLHRGRAAVLSCLAHGDPDARAEFKRGLARAAAEYLGLYDADVRAVYVYDYEPVGAAGAADVPGWMVHLIVWVEPQTAALRSLILALDGALASLVAERLGQTTGRLLDVQFVNSADIEARSGYAALLDVLPLGPTRIWPRGLDPTCAA